MVVGMAKTGKPRTPAVASAAQNAHTAALAVLERFTSTPGKALVELADCDLVVVHISEIVNYQERIEELEAVLADPVYEVPGAHGIVEGPRRIASNLDAWFDAAGNIGQLQVVIE